MNLTETKRKSSQIGLTRWIANHPAIFVAFGSGVFSAYMVSVAINPSLFMPVIVGLITAGLVLLFHVSSSVNRAITGNLAMPMAGQGFTVPEELRLFLYLDITAIDDLFDQIAPKLRLREIRQERGMTSRFGVDIPVGPKISYGGDEEQRMTEAYLQEDTPAMKLSSILDVLEQSRMLVTGLEKFAYDESSKTATEEAVSKIAARLSATGVAITPEDRRDMIAAPLRAVIQKKVNEIQSARGFVMVTGEFEVIESTEDSWTLTFKHPINALLGGEQDYKITAHGGSKGTELTPAGRSHLRANKVRVSVFGNVIEFNDANSELNVNPIAVFP